MIIELVVNESLLEKLVKFQLQDLLRQHNYKVFDKMKKRFELKWLLFLLTLIACESSIVSLQAGTLVVEDKFLRLNTCIFKNVDLQLTKQDFQSIPNIKPIAAIRDMKMNDQLAFQIFYSVQCPRANCQIAFTIERITPKVSELFNYELTIDFLIVSNIRVISVNMTNHRQTLAYEDTQQQHLNGRVTLKSSELQNSMIPLLIPNGFNELSLTGSVVIKHLQQSNIFVLEYNPLQEDSREWTMNKYFIYLKIVFLSQQYLARLRDGTQLAFNGFHSTVLKEITTLASQKYNSFELPLQHNHLFVDNRKIKELIRPSTKQVRQSSTDPFLYRFVIGIALLVCLEMGYLAYRNRVINHQRQIKSRKMTDQMFPQSFEGSTVEKAKEREAQSTVVTPYESEAQIKRNSMQSD